MSGRRVAAWIAALQAGIAWAEAPVSLDQAGAGELALICHHPDNKAERGCVALQKACDEAAKARPGAPPAACRPPPGPMGAVAPARRKVPSPRAFPPALDADTGRCREDGGKCATLADFHARYEDGFKLLSAWCLVRALEKDTGGLDARGRRAAERVCGAIARTTDADTGALSGTPSAYLFVLQGAANADAYECSGFALTLPFVRVRYPAKDVSQVSGPFAAGIGAGHYWAVTCHADWSWGLDAFGYSEGIDVTNDKVHFGVGAGIGLVAYEQFRLGIDLGYDLYRQEADANGVIQRNGLFGFREYGRPSLSYLFTLSFQGKPEVEAAE